MEFENGKHQGNGAHNGNVTRSEHGEQNGKDPAAGGPQRTAPAGARKLLFLAGAVFCLTPWASPPIALALGIILALTQENPFHDVGRKMSKTLLQASVVLLGFGMNLAVVLKAGERGLLFAAATILSTFLLGALVGRWLRINRTVSILISAGTAICGGSAIAAVGSVLNADGGDMSVAMGTVFVLNAVALFLFPTLGHWMGLSQQQFGTWAGVAIHDISSVVGAASRYGVPALQIATAVKLSRALWIVPVALVISQVYRVSEAASQPAKKAKIQVPWFIGLFVLASIMRSVTPGMDRVSLVLTHLATVGLTVTLYLIGAGLSRKTLQAVGWKPIAQGVLLWAVISVGSLLVILHTVK